MSYQTKHQPGRKIYKEKSRKSTQSSRLEASRPNLKRLTKRAVLRTRQITTYGESLGFNRIKDGVYDHHKRNSRNATKYYLKKLIKKAHFIETSTTNCTTELRQVRSVAKHGTNAPV